MSTIKIDTQEELEKFTYSYPVVLSNYKANNHQRFKRKKMI